MLVGSKYRDVTQLIGAGIYEFVECMVKILKSQRTPGFGNGRSEECLGPEGGKPHPHLGL